MSLDEAEAFLIEFFRYHLHLFVPGASSGSQQPISVATQARALLAYIREIRQDKLYLIPARRLAVSADFVGSRVLLIHAAESLNEALAGYPLGVPPMNGLQFPPFAHEKPAGELTAKDSWIGCISPSDQGAYNLLEALLGAISLLLPLPHSRTFSMASRVPYIYCVGGRWIWRLDGPKFPPLGNDHQLTQIDLAVLRSFFDGKREEDAQQRLELGLQFAGAGWAPPSRFSFLHNAIAFDALFGEKGRVRTAIQKEVTLLAAAVPNIEDRIKRLIDIRNALLHGEINAVEGSSEYIPYYEAFNCDPQLDQVQILATCVRSIAGEEPK